MNISISSKNSKMGAIPSISLPAGETCRKDCKCYEECYARKLERIRPNVHAAYKNNLDILIKQPDTYWREVEAQIMVSRFFRWHVSGDIVDSTYFNNMIKISDRNPHCEMLCFTKRYDIVNEFLKVGGIIPSNLHVIFSGWLGMKMENPYNLPEAHVKYSDGSTTASQNAKPCGGNCTNCALTNGGCWSLKSGEQIVFKKH